MGRYLNPGNDAFRMIAEQDYVDKTGLISIVNQTIGTMDSLICISRPRRFGKSYAAAMLSAYYDCGCDSHDLFREKEISKAPDFEKHLNQYHVIQLDITGFLSGTNIGTRDLCAIPRKINDEIRKEVIMAYPDLDADLSLTDMLYHIVLRTGKKFVFIIDEWDAVIREAKNDDAAQKNYLLLLREWFKNGNFTREVVVAAYLTGILPIKKDGSQSAISDFREYTMLDPGPFAVYTGFTEDEVRALCEEKQVSFDLAKAWYDGYTVGEQQSIYNPYSVMCAVKSGKFKSYWKKSSASESLMTYIDMDEEGLQEDIARLIAGEEIEVNPDGFQNDFENFVTKDDVLTLLIHLGYLAYEEEYDGYGEGGVIRPVGYVHIPNEEIRLEFESILRRAKHESLIRLVQRSDQLLKDTLTGNEEAVAKIFSDIRDSEYAPTYYNDEQGLRYVIRFAYISCVDQYAKIEEMPTGHGIADVVYIPKRRSPLPAMVIELKWNKSAGAAIDQIFERNYPAALKGYGGEVVTVGINYNPETKTHTCEIRRV